jgi:hypothetical protein
MYLFKAKIDIIGINPYVLVPENILKKLFVDANKTKGPIPIKGLVNNIPYTQTLIKYKSIWRLYINTKMVKNLPKRIGETIELTMVFDETDRSIAPHPKLIKALNQNVKAKIIFYKLPPSLRKEIVRYISFLKTEKSIDKNVENAINFLLGKQRFIGRNKP